MTEYTPSYVGNLVPSLMNYNKIIESYKKGIREGDFYEEPLGDEFIYPDW